MDLTEEQRKRYSRHIVLPEIGLEGQEKLLNGRVLIIGMGGLGSPAVIYLAAAGVGTIGIVDDDVVDRANLHRQIIHFTPDIGKPKVISTKEKIEQINPAVKVIPYQQRVNAENIIGFIKDYDFVLDCTDTFPAKFLINDGCVLAGKPFSHAGIVRFEGQTMTYSPGNSCLRCLMKDIPPENVLSSCSQAGILGAAAGILGTIQTAETVKFLIGKGDLLVNRMLFIDALNMDFKKVQLQKNPKRPVCGDHPTITKLSNYKRSVC